jgi:hypothetical protein
VPPAPRCLPRATRRGGLRPPQPPPHPDQWLDQSPGAHPGPRPLRMLRGTLLLGKPRTNGPRRWTHRAQEPGRLGRPQQPAGPLLPLQCRQAKGGARRTVGSARWRAAAGCCWKTNWRCASPMPIR